MIEMGNDENDGRMVSLTSLTATIDYFASETNSISSVT
jgi:hypothetical protein